MKHALRIGALLLLPAVTLSGQQRAGVIRLTVKLNGRELRPPTAVTLEFAGRSLRIPVQRGAFQVPAEVSAAKEVTFAAHIGRDHIRIPDLWSVRFREEHWTLILADRSFGEEYRTIVPATAAVPSSCILEFETYGFLGTGMFEPNCRSKRK